MLSALAENFMRKVTTIFIAFMAIVMGTMLAQKPVMAGSYDGPDIRKDITIDKRVALPNGDHVTYVDNISSGTYTFRPDNTVWFELRIKNTSNVDLINVKVADFGPQYFQLLEEGGILIDGQNILNIEAGDFKAGEEKVFIVKGRINNKNAVPNGVTCITNRARAGAGGVADEDTAQFCFSKNEPTPTPVTVVRTKGSGTVTKTVTIPSTGPEHTFTVVVISTILGYIGLKLKNRA